MTGREFFRNDTEEYDYMDYSYYGEEETGKDKAYGSVSGNSSTRRKILSEVITFLQALTNILDIINENIEKFIK